jgi:hypothetical protein
MAPPCSSSSPSAAPAPSPKFIRLAFYALAVLFAIPYGALNSVNQTSQAVFGGAPGASANAVALADDLSRTANVALSSSWLVFLFFVPAALGWLRGARNAFAVMMFAWAGAAAALVGAFALSLREGVGPATPAGVSAGMRACAVLFGLLVGVFGGLGYTATEVYLDTCAEWMPLALDAAADGGSGKDRAAAVAVAPAPAPADDGAEGEGEGEAAVDATMRHKLVASKYKNLFASHIYAFVEVGTVAFTLPGALGAVDGPRQLYLLIAITACLLAGAAASLCVPNLQDPSAGAKGEQDAGAGGGDEEAAGGSAAPPPPPRASCLSAFASAVARAVVDAGTSAVRSITCLSAYRGLAALAIVPYFLSAAYADNYFQFVVLGTQCGLRAKPAGIGLEGASTMALFGSAVQALSAFAGPALVGPRRFQFREHVYPLAIGNAAGAAGALLVVGLGGLTQRLCSSLPLMLATKALSSIAYGINNSVGVAAVLCWYSGSYQHLVVAALASRSVWTQLGGIIGPYTFSDAFATLGGGAPAAGFAAAIYLAGSACVVVAHLTNEATQKRRLAALARAPAPVSEADLRLAGAEGRMTAGFSDAAAAAAYRQGSVVRRRAVGVSA